MHTVLFQKYQQDNVDMYPMSNSCPNCPYLVTQCPLSQITFLLGQLRSWVMFPVPPVRDATSFFISMSALVMLATIIALRKISGRLIYMTTCTSHISILCASGSLSLCFQYHSILDQNKQIHPLYCTCIYSLTLGMEDQRS